MTMGLLDLDCVIFMRRVNIINLSLQPYKPQRFFLPLWDLSDTVTIPSGKHI